MAIHHYHDAMSELPPSRIHDRFLTWAALILPYMEEHSIGDLLDAKRTFDGQEEVFRITPIKAFRCPSRPHRGLTTERNGVRGLKGDYSAVTSTFLLEGPLGRLFDGAMILGDTSLEDDGVIENWKSRTSLNDIRDGLSKTLLIAEASRWACERASIYDGDDNPGAILGDRVYPLEADNFAQKHSLWSIAKTESEPAAWVGSAHPSVVCVTMADGSTHIITKDADIKIVEHLVTRASGETTTLTDISRN
jgi:hypothetical protein